MKDSTSIGQQVCVSFRSVATIIRTTLRLNDKKPRCVDRTSHVGAYCVSTHCGKLAGFESVYCCCSRSVHESWMGVAVNGRPVAAVGLPVREAEFGLESEVEGPAS